MKDRQLMLKQFKEKFFNKFPNSTLEILEYKDVFTILVKDKYGICKTSASSLLKGNFPTIVTALNKTEYFINKAKELHGNKYDYSLVEYKDIHTKVKIICKKHGLFEQRTNNHLLGINCSKCMIKECALKRRSTIEKFIEKANKVHNNKYKYENTIYLLKADVIDIECPIHGNFKQRADNHLQGKGCDKCKNNLTSKRNKENPMGWDKSSWFKKASNNKDFKSFKVYIIKCWNKNEEFYKIGRTFRSIEKRFYGRAMPYNYKIVQVFEFEELTEENCNECFDLETRLKQENKKYKYLPQIDFNGRHECFKEVDI